MTIRRILVGVAVLVVVVAGLWFAAPYLFVAAINLTCRQAVVSTSCQARMRAVGHLFSYRGNLDQALRWYAVAAGAGDRVAMFHAGWTQSELAAAEMRRNVAEAVQGNGVLYTPGYFGPHAVSAAEWYRRSADLDFAPAINNLGEMYREGFGVGENARRSYDYHLRAAKAGNPVARINLSRDYREGIGTNVDIAKAEQWWQPDFRNTNQADLAEPTLARTFIRGKIIGPDERERMRRLAQGLAAAKTP